MFTCTLYYYAHFLICFNAVRKQPDFVIYQQQVLGGCDNCHFRQEPATAYPPDAYKAISLVFDRGHLVPNADFGSSTYIMGNVVPQVRLFNRGPWRILEKRLRDNYSGDHILKGCYYQDRNIAGIAIPEGCYWLVFDQGQVKEIGYIDQFTGETYETLPPGIGRSLELSLVRNFTGILPAFAEEPEPAILPPQSTPNVPPKTVPSLVPTSEIVLFSVVFVLVAIALLVHRRLTHEHAA